MKANTDPDVFPLDMDQLRDKLSNCDEVISTEHSTTTILDALPAEKYSTIKLEVKRDPDLSSKQRRFSPITRKGCQLPKVVKSPKDTKSRILGVGKMVGSQQWQLFLLLVIIAKTQFTK